MTETISKLFRLLNLGEPLAAPGPVSGGYLHKMLRVETARGFFAVKALNPDIMMRPEALGNMRHGEQIALALQDCVPLCAASSGVAEMDGAYFIVYPWAEGVSVFAPEITAEHCRIMGNVLGCIHRADVRIPGMEPETALRQPYDWSLMADERLPRWDAAALDGLRRLQAVQVISHRDLDPKNVLWQGLVPCVIDWEAAGYVNPWQELIELLNYWADDEEKVRAMIAAYGQHVDLRAADWDAALAAGVDGILGWLHYNLRRAAGMEGTSPEDKAAGEEHVRNTLRELEQYEDRMAFLRRLLG